MRCMSPELPLSRHGRSDQCPLCARSGHTSTDKLLYETLSVSADYVVQKEYQRLPAGWYNCQVPGCHSVRKSLESGLSTSEEIGLDEVSEFALFRAIVESGGISAAALALQSSPAAVSRRLSALEAKLGVRLAERSSRRFRLTDEGLLLFERCCSILDQIRDAEAEVASRGGAARGLLRIGAPADFGRKHIAPLLPAFTTQHPGLD